MAHEPGQFDELEALLTRMLDGELSDADHATMSRLLEADMAAQVHYVDFVMTHALLRSELAPGSTAIALEPREAEAERPTATGDASVGSPIRFASLRMRRAVAIAAMVTLVGLVTLAVWRGWRAGGADDAGGSAGAGVAVATLVDGTDAEWSETSTVGDWMSSGASVRAGVVSLRGGTAQLMFETGALVTLNGPTELHMTDANRCELRRGRLLAAVPPQARGFTVDTPGGQVVDLGTRFAVVVDDAGVVEVHVLEGTVEAAIDLPDGRRTPRTLRGGAATRYGLGGQPGKSTAVPVDGVSFGVSPERPTPGVRYAGSQLSLARFRTRGVVKSRDADGDAIYGTSGYVLFGMSTEATADPQWIPDTPVLSGARVALPGYVASVRGENGAMPVRGGTFLRIDAPVASPDNSEDNNVSDDASIHSGAIGVNRFTKVGHELAMCSIVIGRDVPAGGFRVGVLTNNQPIRPDQSEYLNNLPATLRVAVAGRAGRGFDSGPITLDRAASRLGRGDWYFFDVAGVAPGDVLTIYAANHRDSGSNVRNKNIPYAGQLIGGLVFDEIHTP